MANTVGQAIAYARAHPTRLDFETGKYGSWAGWCASFVYRAGGFDRAYSSAMIAGSSSGILAADYRSAQRGSIHYWSGVGGDGHVAIDIGGDSSDRLLLMASSSVTDSFGTAVGAVWMSQYARLGIPYRGHTFAWGSERLASTEQSAPQPAEAAAPKLEVSDMPKIIAVPGGTIALVGELTANPYKDFTAGSQFSITANSAAYGVVSGFTEDMASTLIREANERGAEFRKAMREGR